MSLFCVKRLLKSIVTDRPTNRQTDGPTEKWLIESRSTRLKTSWAPKRFSSDSLPPPSPSFIFLRPTLFFSLLFFVFTILPILFIYRGGYQVRVLGRQIKVLKIFFFFKLKRRVRMCQYAKVCLIISSTSGSVNKTILRLLVSLFFKISFFFCFF